jgi:hypothetical protein
MFKPAFAPKIAQLVLAIVLVTFLSSAADTPANVAGTWTISVTGAAGSAEQTVTLVQSGSQNTGTFKGPRQSGPLEGTVDGSNIKFHVATGVPIDFTGTVDGDSMKGTLSARGKSGDWTARRVNQ